MDAKNKNPQSVRLIVRASSRTNKQYNSKKWHKLNRDLLPNPADYYFKELKKFHPRKNGQATGICPFHSDRNPSFSVNLRNGAFFCFACGTSGGGIIDFHMKKNGLSFTQALRDLGVSYGR